MLLFHRGGPLGEVVQVMIPKRQLSFAWLLGSMGWCLLLPEPSCRSALLDPPGPGPGGSCSFHQGVAVWCPKEWSLGLGLHSANSWLCDLPRGSTSVHLSFHARNTLPTNPLEERGMRWCLWNCYFSQPVLAGGQ